MISRTQILQTLDNLQHMYNSKHKLDVSFYSKTAVVEACGWIEEALDDILFRCVDCSVSDKGRIKHMKDTVIKRNYGFDYETNLCNMLRQIIGYVNIQKIEKRLSKSKRFINMRAELGNLKAFRNPAAHTYMQLGITPTFDTPQRIKERLSWVGQGLLQLEKELIKMNFIR